MSRLELALVAEDRLSLNAAAVARRASDVVNDGWSYAQETVPLSATVSDVQAIIARHGPSHAQILGHVPVPQLYRLVNSDDSGVGDCDYPYTIGGNTVARIDVKDLPVSETAAFDRVLQRHHDYRIGAFSYSGVGLINNRLASMDSTLTPRLSASMATTVGAANIWDVTSKYPDDTFFESYSGRTALLAALFSGGNPQNVDGWQGDQYYLGSLPHVCSGRVQMGGVQVFCSFGWQFYRWALMRGLLVGGSLWAIYNPWGQRDLSAWSDTVCIAEAARPFVMDTVSGDGALFRRKQDMGVLLTDFNNLYADVQVLKAALPVLQSGYTQIQQQVAELVTGTAGGTSAGQQGGGSVQAPIIAHGSFDSPALAAGTYQTGGGVATGWAITGYLSSVGSQWTTPPGEGPQALALTSRSQGAQLVNNMVVGAQYEITVKAVQRPAVYNTGGVQMVNVYMDDLLVGSITPGAAWAAYTLEFNAKAASQLLRLAGANAGDSTAYVTGVSISPVAQAA